MTARILAVDDSDQNLLLMELCQEGEDLELVQAGSAREAIELTAAESFDLVVLSMAMPEIDSLDLCQQLKADPRTAQLPVILVADESDDVAERDRTELNAAVDCPSMVLRKEELAARIKAILQLRTGQKKLEEENQQLTSLLQDSRDSYSELETAFSEAEEILGCRSRDPCCYLLLDASGKVVGADGLIEQLLGIDPIGLQFSELPEPIGGMLSGHSEQAKLPDFEIAGSIGNRQISPGLRSLGSGQRLLYFRDVTEQRAREQRLRDRKAYPSPALSRSLEEGEYRISGLIGSGRGMLEVSALAEKLRNVRTTVLIHGETGTGKELVARALHYDGRYANTPFIPIHCGAISAELIESELFGYEKGAFTGATTRKDGLFKAAHSGTVFLDEVSETSMELQVKLLRVLQLGEIRPVGATHAQQVDVRILAATNRDLRKMLQDGDFREDLFYRLKVVTIRLPALCERPEDLPALAQHIIGLVCERQGRQGHPHGISKGAMDLLRCYSWPGNVRELENVIEAAISLGCGELIQEADLPLNIREGDPVFSPRPSVLEPRAILPGPQPVENSLASRSQLVVRGAILDALSRFEGDKRRAASFLGMSRSTFYRKLKEHGVG